MVTKFDRMTLADKILNVFKIQKADGCDLKTNETHYVSNSKQRFRSISTEFSLAETWKRHFEDS